MNTLFDCIFGPKVFKIHSTFNLLTKGIQYVFRYHKYEKTSREPDSPAHTPTTSYPASRAMSTTTLLSEVISMVKLRPKPSVKHARLRESVDVDNLESQDGQEMEVLKSPR